MNNNDLVKIKGNSELWNFLFYVGGHHRSKPLWFCRYDPDIVQDRTAIDASCRYMSIADFGARDFEMCPTYILYTSDKNPSKVGDCLNGYAVNRDNPSEGFHKHCSAPIIEVFPGEHGSDCSYVAYSHEIVYLVYQVDDSTSSFYGKHTPMCGQHYLLFTTDHNTPKLGQSLIGAPINLGASRDRFDHFVSSKVMKVSREGGYDVAYTCDDVMYTVIPV